MDLRQLEYFVTVVDEGGFGRAAARLFAAQSTVSAGVRALEREVGASLFERDTHRVALTPAGEVALPRARRLLDEWALLRDEVADDGELRGTLRIGILTNVLVRGALPRVLGTFRARHPGVQLHLSPSATGSAGLGADLAAGRIDVAFLGAEPTEAVADRACLIASEFVAVLPADHPLAASRTVPLARLAEEDFVDSPAGFGQRSVFDAALAARGLARRTIVEVGDVAQIPEFVAAGLGVAAMPRYLVPDAPRGAGFALRPLDERIEWRLLIAVRPGASRAARVFVDAVAAEVAAAPVLPGDSARTGIGARGRRR
ncbi:MULTISPECIES: LysR family transcriptional regulator [Microbacterium]|uniref:LysR family transcriptional regulator n=1 Tax=Microbacterium TaxID=33882 RepID=UPI0010F6642C|nr:LysR family transcriptional regulator [Microbacterium sp. 4NA327F11]MCK9916648.1 LysR family transcriptional regulator [Microbacteriaceae bacterium K1510]